MFYSVVANIMQMNNKIAMVNKELHTRLFEERDNGDHEQERAKSYHKHQIPPQIILKNMIKKGLTNPQTPNSRPKTALTNFRRTADGREPLSRLKSIDATQLAKRISYRRYDLVSDNNVEFDFITTHPKEFNEFDQILDRMKWQREQQVSRKRVKLEKYGQRKFRYAWRKSNIPH